MKNQLFIWPCNTPEDAIRWLEWDRSSSQVLSQGQLENGSALAQLQPHASRNQVILLLPGSSCFYTQVQLPNTSKQAQTAIPFMLEDKLCQPIEDLHIAHRPMDSALNRQVVAVEHTLMQTWIDAFNQAQIQLETITPDYLALPLQPDYATLLHAGPELVCRYPQHAASMPAATFQQWQPLLPEVSTVNELGGGATCENSTSSDSAHAALASLASGFNPKDLVNLRQAQYLPQGQLSVWGSKLKLAAALAAIALCAQFAIFKMESAKLQQQITDYDTQVKQVFVSAFPETRRVINPRSQMKAKLAQMKRGSGNFRFLEIMNQAAPTLANAQGIKLEQIRYLQKDNAVKLTLSAPDFESINNLQSALNSKSLRAEPGAYQQTGSNQVSAQITLQD